MKKLIIFIFGLSISLNFAMELPERPKRPLEEELQDMPDPSEIIEIAKKQKIEAQVIPVPMEIEPIAAPSSLGQFEPIAPEIQEIIIKYLVTATGRTPTQKLYNAADTIRNFLMTNKYFKENFLDNINFNGWVIQELAQRYTGNNIVKAAMALGTKAASQLLKERFSQYIISIHHFLINAAYEGNQNDINFLLSLAPQNQLFNAIGEEGMNLLMAAARGGSLSLIEKIVTSGLIPVNAADQRGGTALIRAADNAHTAVVERLLAAGANVNVANQQGNTALMLAAHNGHTAIVEQLLAAGANINVANQLGGTALIVAAYNGHTAVVERLLAAGGANANAADQQGGTALMVAAQNGHMAVVKRLLAASANINAANQQGGTALMVAAKNGHTAIVERLLAAGANVNAINQYGGTTLMIAAFNGHIDIVRRLLAAKADITKTIRGETALKFAQRSESPHKDEIIKLLREAGAQ